MTTSSLGPGTDRPVPASDRLELAGMAADSYGVDDARAPIVLLHGLTYSRRTWLPVVAELEHVDPGRRVVALDLPGHGQSPAQAPHSLAHVAELLDRAVTDAGLRDPVLVGHSMSGGLAMVYGASHPVRGVVNVDAPPDEFVGFSRQLQSMAAALEGPGFAQIWAGLRAGFGLQVLPAPLRDLVDATSTPRQDLVLSYWQEVLESSADDVGAMLAGVGHELGRRRVPVLLLLGHEPSPDLAPLLAETGIEGRVEVWPGCGHFPHLARLGEFAEMLAQTADWSTSTSFGDKVVS